MGNQMFDHEISCVDLYSVCVYCCALIAMDLSPLILLPFLIVSFPSLSFLASRSRIVNSDSVKRYYTIYNTLTQQFKR